MGKEASGAGWLTRLAGVTALALFVLWVLAGLWISDLAMKPDQSVNYPVGLGAAAPLDRRCRPAGIDRSRDADASQHGRVTLCDR